MISFEFLLTSLVVVLIPGIGVIYTIATGLFSGKRASCVAALGCTLGIIPALLASVFGLATLLHTSALVFQLVKYAGVIYLLYLAWQMWRTARPLSVDDNKRPATYCGIALKGFLINILNPKLTLFFLAFFPQFMPEHTDSVVIAMLIMGGLFMLITFCIFVAYGFLSGVFSQFILSSENANVRTQKGFAACFAMLGVKLAVS